MILTLGTGPRLRFRFFGEPSKEQTMPARLTTRPIEALHPGQELRCDRVPGLYVVCSGRTITYGLQYRHGGKRRRETLGHHPAITLGEARRSCREVGGNWHGAGPEWHGGRDQAARSRSVGERSRVGQPSTRRMVI